MTIQTFIEKAILGGWQGHSSSYYEANPAVWGVFLDPLAWKAVGKVEGWAEETEYEISCEDLERTFQVFERAVQKTWLYNMHRMIDALAEGKTIEQFLETL